MALNNEIAYAGYISTGLFAKNKRESFLVVISLFSPLAELFLQAAAIHLTPQASYLRQQRM